MKWSEVNILVSPLGAFQDQFTMWGTLARLLITKFTIILGSGRWLCPDRSDYNTRDFVPYSYRIVSGFLNVPHYLISNKGYETGPPVYSPYPRRLESLTMCRYNYKGSTFSSVMLRPWVRVRSESNSRHSALQPGVQPTEPPVCGGTGLEQAWIKWSHA